jgi:hypothetical protein
MQVVVYQPHPENGTLVPANQPLAGAGNDGECWLLVAQQQLAPYVHSPQGAAVLAIAGRNVQYNWGRILPYQVGLHRPSYINGILIQSRGVLCAPCYQCRGRLDEKYFPECRRLPGHFGGACGNCKWPDGASSCSYHDDRNRGRGERIIDLTQDGDDDDDDDVLEVAAGASRGTAIEL